MKLHVYPTISARFSVLCVALLLSCLPNLTSAATAKPTCTLTATTPNGTVLIKKSDDILITKGDTLHVKWQGKNAKIATLNGKTISFEGSSTSTPDTTKSYVYIFKSGSKKVSCSVTVHVISGHITPSTLSSTSQKPTLSGTAHGVEKVQIKIYKKDDKKVFYTSRVIRVMNDKWKSGISKNLPNGTYDVILIGDKNFSLNVISKETLRIGKTSVIPKNPDTTIVVVPVPLLMGGTAKSGSTISVGYLQVINLGKNPASIKGFTIKQNGNASTDSIIGISATDDTGISKGLVGGEVGDKPFVKGSITVPIEATLLPEQMRLFTIKAILGSNLALYTGSQIKIDVTGVDTTAALQNGFPIRGTTWTIGL